MVVVFVFLFIGEAVVKLFLLNVWSDVEGIVIITIISVHFLNTHFEKSFIKNLTIFF